MNDKKGSKRLELKQDALVEQLVEDPSEVTESIMLTGFLGKSSQPGYHRLYLTAKLDQFYEVAEKDILRADQVASEKSNVGGTTLWVRQDATIKHTFVTKARQVQADFLKGAVMDKFLSRANNATVLEIKPLGYTVDIPTWIICAVSSAASAYILYTCIGFHCNPTPSCQTQHHC